MGWKEFTKAAFIARMSGNYHSKLPSRLLTVAVPIAMLGASASAGSSEPLTDPMRFFEGKTEGVSTIRVVTKKPYKSRTVGRGEIKGGVLQLVQRVHEEDKPPFDRHWRMRQVGPGRFSGTMSEARGLVTVEEVDGRYRFRFKMKGNVAVEQWLTPTPSGKSAQSKLIIRKFGMTVGRSEGTIRKL